MRWNWKSDSCIGLEQSIGIDTLQCRWPMECRYPWRANRSRVGRHIHNCFELKQQMMTIVASRTSSSNISCCCSSSSSNNDQKHHEDDDDDLSMEKPVWCGPEPLAWQITVQGATTVVINPSSSDATYDPSIRSQGSRCLDPQVESRSGHSDESLRWACKFGSCCSKWRLDIRKASFPSKGFDTRPRSSLRRALRWPLRCIRIEERGRMSNFCGISDLKNGEPNNFLDMLDQGSWSKTVTWDLLCKAS